MKVNQFLMLGALIMCSLFETATYGASYWAAPTNESYGAGAGYWSMPANFNLNNLNLGDSGLDDDDNLNYQNLGPESIYDLDALLAAADEDNA